MKALIATRGRRLSWTLLVMLLATILAFWIVGRTNETSPHIMSDGELMTRLFAFPALASGAVFALLTAFAGTGGLATAQAAAPQANAAVDAPESAKPFMAQVVGLQWLNPLQRRDYPTEWQLLWTLGLVQPNKNDDMVKMNPTKYGKLGPVANVASGNDGRETFKGYQYKYFRELTTKFHDIYFMDSDYFYNAHSLTDRSTWRELAGIHVEYALPEGKLDPLEAATTIRTLLIDTFDIGNPNFPKAWSRSTPPDVHVTMGGPNAGFTSLSSGLDYLQKHPNETVWVLNWDAPNFPPKDKQINENLVLLVLAGANYKTEREPLAWLGYPATKKVDEFQAEKGKPSRASQAWKATLDAATHNAGKRDTEVGFVIHDANNAHTASSDRMANLAETLTRELVEFDFMKQTFNTPALLGEMGAGTALTNVALGIAYANHFGKNVLVAGTTDPAQPTAVLVVPPSKVRPIRPDDPWSRARGENSAYLPWWGLRHDATEGTQGYSR